MPSSSNTPTPETVPFNSPINRILRPIFDAQRNLDAARLQLRTMIADLVANQALSENAAQLLHWFYRTNDAFDYLATSATTSKRTTLESGFPFSHLTWPELEDLMRRDIWPSLSSCGFDLQIDPVESENHQIRIAMSHHEPETEKIVSLAG